MGPLTGVLAVALAVATACYPNDMAVAPNTSCDDNGCDCTLGYANCDGKASNGCETQVSVDPLHCGACRAQCRNGACVGGRCEPLSGAYGDCNDDLSDGFEAHLATDPRNCGACGVDCLEGACAAGACQPFEVMSAGALIEAMIARDETLYVCDHISGTVMQVAELGGVPQPLAIDQTFPSGHGNGTDMAVDDTYLYWLSTAFLPNPLPAEASVLNVMRRDDPTDHRILTTEVADEHDLLVEDIATMEAEGGTLLWSVHHSGLPDPSQYSVRLAEVDSGDITDVTSDAACHQVALLDGQACWSNSANIVCAPVTEPSNWQLLVATELQACPLHLADGRLFWIERFAGLDDGAYDLMAIDLLAPEQRTVLFSGHGRVDELIADASGVYWVVRDSLEDTLLWLQPGALAPVVVSEHSDIDAFTLGARVLLWTQDGQLRAVAKEAAAPQP